MIQTAVPSKPEDRRLPHTARILKKALKLYDHLIKMGIGSMDPGEPLAKSIRMANTLSFYIALLILTVGSLIIYLTGKVQFIVPAGIEFIVACQVFMLNRLKHHITANMLMFNLQCISVIYFTYELGEALNLLSVGVFLGLILFILFTGRTERLIAMACCSVSYLAMLYLLCFDKVKHLDLTDDYRFFMNVSANFGVFVLIGIVVKIYIQSNDIRLLLEKQHRQNIAMRDKIAHDCRNAVNVTESVAYSQKQALEKGSSKEVLGESIDKILAACTFLNVAFTNILNYSRNSSDAILELNEKEVNPCGFLDSIFSIYQVCCHAYGRELEYSKPKQLPLAIKTDQVRLKQAIMNLLGNALKYGDPGTPILAEVRLRREELVISISNTCDDIPEEQLERLFGRFQMGNNRGAVEGHGLGLHDIWETMELMGGRVEVESFKRLTTFTIQVPIELTKPELQPTTAALPVEVNIDSPKASLDNRNYVGKVLVCEDEQMAQTYMEKILGDKGFKVLQAHSGKDVLKTIRDEKPDLIFLDKSLPVMDGRQILAAIQEDENLRFIPVVMTTGDDHAKQDAYLVEKTADILIKPIREQEIDQVLKNLLVLTH